MGPMRHRLVYLPARAAMLRGRHESALSRLRQHLDPVCDTGRDCFLSDARIHQRDANEDVTQRGRLLMMAVEASTQFDVMSGNREQLQRTIEQAMREEPLVAGIQIYDEPRHVMASASAENSERAVAQFSTPIRTELSTADLF